MNMIRTLALAGTCAVAALTVASPAMAVTSFYNDFESGAFPGTGYHVLSSYEGWSTSSGPGIEVQFGNVAGLSHSGRQHVELDSNANSAMSRSIDQGLYTLNFFYSDRPGIAAASNGVDVLLNGSVIFTVPGGNGAGGTVWTPYTLNFAANLAGPNTLTFAAIGKSDSLGGYLDDIRLSGAVPEPATWAMMIGGFALVGASLRRRATGVRFA